jgi:hypothetical protein
MWIAVLLNMLGEQFPHSELVNGASVMSNQVGNNLVKVWLASTDKSKVQATREFLQTILDAADYMPNVTFVPHKLVVKGAGKKVSNRITQAPAHSLAAAPSNSNTFSEYAFDKCPLIQMEMLGEAGPNGLRQRTYHELTITAPGHYQPNSSPYPRSPESTLSFGFGGALSSIPSSRCSEHSSMPPSPRPLSPAASYTGSEWEADCGAKLMPPSPAYPCHAYPRMPQRRSWSVTSQDYSYTHNPYSLANSVIYTNTSA